MIYRKKLESSVPEAKPFGRTTDCKARGCPFPGGIRLTNYESICRVHETVAAQHWPIATQRICERVDELDRAIAASNASPRNTEPYERFIEEICAGLK